jgi:predicted enzyme related to lactoylglutathione lyase
MRFSPSMGLQFLASPEKDLHLWSHRLWTRDWDLGLETRDFATIGKNIMKRIWTIIGVRDVASSFRWYQTLFGQTATAPAHDYFGQIVDADGTVLLCLHQWGEHDHPTLTSPDGATPGNGLILFFRVDDFCASLGRARTLVAQLEEEPNDNPSTGTREFALRDPDGYYVMVSALEN